MHTSSPLLPLTLPTDRDTLAEPHECPECHRHHVSFLRVCDPCMELRRATLPTEATQRAQTKLNTTWKAIGCPPAYESTDWDRRAGTDEVPLHPICRTLALHWWVPSQTSTGLGICGSTGQGKSRALWAILRRHHFANYSVSWLNAYDLSRLAAEASSYRPSTTRTDARKRLQHAATVQILALDDLGKEVADKTTAAALHQLIETRCAHLRPILFTTEKPANALAARFGNDYADGIIRRLRERCEIRRLE